MLCFCLLNRILRLVWASLQPTDMVEFYRWFKWGPVKRLLASKKLYLLLFHSSRIPTNWRLSFVWLLLIMHHEIGILSRFLDTRICITLYCSFSGIHMANVVLGTIACSLSGFYLFLSKLKLNRANFFCSPARISLKWKMIKNGRSLRQEKHYQEQGQSMHITLKRFHWTKNLR